MEDVQSPEPGATAEQSTDAGTEEQSFIRHSSLLTSSLISPLTTVVKGSKDLMASISVLEVGSGTFSARRSNDVSWHLEVG
eukprot:scaffold72605_cov44-Prasinocladus_malaysianus.AAC.1